MNFLECFKVRNSEKIKESYMVEDNRITVNISKEKYDKLLYSFIDNKPAVAGVNNDGIAYAWGVLHLNA